MAEQVPEKYSDLFKKKAFANLSTLMKDGSPQVTPCGSITTGSTCV